MRTQCFLGSRKPERESSIRYLCDKKYVEGNVALPVSFLPQYWNDKVPSASPCVHRPNNDSTDRQVTSHCVPPFLHLCLLPSSSCNSLNHSNPILVLVVAAAVVNTTIPWPVLRILRMHHRNRPREGWDTRDIPPS